MEINLKGSIRENIGTSNSKRLRGDGSIPAVLYGLGIEPIALIIDERDFKNAMKTEAGSNVILNLEIDSKKYTTLARQIQRHPYKDHFLHVDLIQVDLTKTVEADVQLHFIGIPVGVKEEGGIIQTINSSIAISCLPTSIPSFLEIDISKLNVGDNISASEIKLPPNVVLANSEDDSVLVTITLPRAAIEEDEVLEGLEGEEFEGEDGAESESSQENNGEESSDESGE